MRAPLFCCRYMPRFLLRFAIRYIRHAVIVNMSLSAYVYTRGTEIAGGDAGPYYAVSAPRWLCY